MFQLGALPGVIIVLLCGLLFPWNTRPATGEIDSFELENGLHVILQPLASAKTVALVVLYDVGNLHDPENQSGMAHLAEHLYVTGATDKRPARTVQEYVKAYPDGWNAQTGDDYTVIATVFKPDRLPAEIDDAAERMKKITVTQADLQRELPRMQQELENMYERMPSLAARNLGRERLRPLASGGRRGGVIEQLKTISVEQIQAWLDDHYKPDNAVLVLAGPFDRDNARQLLTKHFAGIPTGSVPAKRERPQMKGERRIEIAARTYRPDEPVRVGLTFAAPTPDDELYPAFLVHAARMQMAGRQLVKDMRDFPVAYMPIDQPGFLFVTLPVDSAGTSDQALERLKNFVDEQTGRELGRGEGMRAKTAMGLLLGGLPARFQAQNPYGTAFSTGRRHQMQIDAAKLTAAIENVTDEQLKLAQQSFFDDSKSVAVVVRPNK